MVDTTQFQTKSDMFEAYPTTPALSRDEIRLIRLLPGAWTDDLQCELVYDTLSNVRPYHALSYVWGSSKKSRTISLDGNPFAVTINLESTLRHLRRPTENILLWIDALCINQENDSERTHQVNLMGSIYRSSKGVLVYLGDGIGRSSYSKNPKLDRQAPPSTIFFDDARDEPHIQKFMQPNAFQISLRSTNSKSDRRMRKTIDVFSFIRTLASVEHLVDISWLTAGNDDSEVEEALLHLFENLRRLMHAPFTPWWGRIWVVQEVILPPQITICCGTVSAPWSMFSRAASACLQHMHDCCAKELDRVPRDLMNVLQDFGERVTDVDNLRNTSLGKMFHISSLFEPGMDRIRRSFCPAERRSLISLLRQFRERKASDPRDKVYALLSLVQDDSKRAPLMPDYSLSTAEVYTMAAVESIYSSGSLSVLTVDNARKYRQDLPTWVPDWEAPGDFGHNTRLDYTTLYDACATYPVDSDTVKVRDRALVIEGLSIDVIIKCGPTMLSDSHEIFMETLSEWLFQSRGFRAVTGTTNVEKLLWRVFCADVLYAGRDSYNSGDLFRRMEEEDELMFVTWALTSGRSPFLDPIKTLPRHLSKAALLWMYILEFETSISDEQTEAIGHIFFTLFPELSTRKDIIESVIETHNPDQLQENLSREHREELVAYATLDRDKLQDLDWEAHAGQVTMDDLNEAHVMIQMRACKAQSDRNHLRAWKEVPWARVLEVVRTELLQRLGSASKIGQIPYHRQASLIERSIVNATKARKFFITAQGYVGLGPADLQCNDVIHLLKGARTPMILRPCERKTSFQSYCRLRCTRCNRTYSTEDLMHTYACRCSNCLKRAPFCPMCRGWDETFCYTVIGDCYAHGFMYSQSVQEHVEKPDSHSWMEINLV